MILKKTLVRLAVFEFVEISRPAGPLLFDRKAMLTSAGVFSTEEHRPKLHHPRQEYAGTNRLFELEKSPRRKVIF